MSTSTASNMAPPKVTNELWGILFKTVHEGGLLTPTSCDLLGLKTCGTPYHKNNHFQVADITLKKLRTLEYDKFPNLTVEMIFSMLGMLGPGQFESDQASRKRWADRFTQFLQSMVVTLKGKAVMGGNVNDLLTMYFEKLTRKFTSKKALSAAEGSARLEAIRVACGCAPTIVDAPVPLVVAALAPSPAPLPVEPEVVFVHPEEVPDSWDE